MTDQTLMVDSKWYPDQNPNDLTIQLDEEINNVHGVRIIYAGIPCSFYNISQEIGNNNILIHDGKKWSYLNLPDGFYDIRSFDRQVGAQLKRMGLFPRAFRFDLDETTGKIVISFRKQRNNQTYKFPLEVTTKIFSVSIFHQIQA